MAANETQSTSRGGCNIEKEHDTALTYQEHAFSKALHSFIVPLLQAVAGSEDIDIGRCTLRPEDAVPLIAALKDLIRSVVKPIECLSPNKANVVVETDTPTSTEALASPVDRKIYGSATLQICSPMTMLEDKLLGRLRERVFNKMPIQLLSFEERDSVLEITLLNRGEIFAYLKAKVLSGLPTYFAETNMSSVDGEHDEDTLIDARLDANVKYAILSHTWLHSTPGEISYGEWTTGRFDHAGTGYRKLVNFCKAAYRNHGLTLGWMDTVCINKDSSAELDESIRSMYTWYERSKVCIVYLAETGSLTEMHSDSWFMRGWTLQELLAPPVLKFYNRRWERLTDAAENDKTEGLIRDEIAEATSMTVQELMDIRSSTNPVPLSRRMQLAARRAVTREEDTAYSLMGLFNVSITTAYGEGAERAFYRLLQEILASHSYGVLDLFNWAGAGNYVSTSRLLPSTPQHYLERSASVNLKYFSQIEPLTLTHMGLRVPVILMPGVSIGDGRLYEIPCGSYSAVVSMSPVKYGTPIPTTYQLLSRRISGSDILHQHPRAPHSVQITFAVFNILQSGRDIIIRAKCIAIPLACYEGAGKVTSAGGFDRIYTKEPVVFDMLRRNFNERNRSGAGYMVRMDPYTDIRHPQKDLGKHGMQLVFKYL